jgi:hypothetical protein
MRLSCHACTRACACMRAYLFPFLSVKTRSDLCVTNVYERICFLFVHFYEHARQSHTRAHTCRDHLHTLELQWSWVWRWFALAPKTIIHTNIHTECMCVCVYIRLVCLFFWVYLTVVCLTLWTLCYGFSSIQVAWFAQQPVVGPASWYFCWAFIAFVSECVSRGCLQSTLPVLGHVDVHVQTTRRRCDGAIA